MGKYVKFRVTPKTSAEPKAGETYTSPAVLCAAKPYVTDVKIENKGNNLYTVSYKYNHDLGVKEGATVIMWSNGETGASTSVSKSAGSITVTVTPVAVFEPSKGEPVSATAKISSGNKQLIIC